MQKIAAINIKVALEYGPGKVLAGLAKHCADTVEGIALADAASINTHLGTALIAFLDVRSDLIAHILSTDIIYIIEQISIYLPEIHVHHLVPPGEKLARKDRGRLCRLLGGGALDQHGDRPIGQRRVRGPRRQMEKQPQDEDEPRPTTFRYHRHLLLEEFEEFSGKH